jgi:hypothetical protein
MVGGGTKLNVFCEGTFLKIEDSEGVIILHSGTYSTFHFVQKRTNKNVG